MESYRHKLMAAKPRWGDPVGSRCKSWCDQSWCDQPQPTQEQLQVLPPTASSSESFWSADGDLPYMNGHRPLPKSRGFITTENWSLETLLKSGDRFRSVPRLSAFSSSLEASIPKYEQSGIPLIIEKYHQHPKWPRHLFSIETFSVQSRNNVITARNVRNGIDMDLPLSEFIEKSRAMSPFATPDEPERLYGKDAHCPHEWNEWLHNTRVLPSSLLPDGSNNMLLNVPKSERVKTLMCYLGIGDTFTPCHKDLCASSGQNIMCYTENSGSSFWFMTASSDAPAVAKYFHKLKQELDHETYIISVEELAAAPFDVYIAEQKLGDMVLVPPRSCHQVVNYGGITIKTSWSRMTINGLAAAIYHELPIYRRVCRPETYRVKYTLYHTLLSHTKELENLHSRTAIDDMGESSSPSTSESSECIRLPVSSSRNEPPVAYSSDRSRKEYLARNYRHLIALFDDVVIEEYCKEHSSMPCLASSSNSFGDMDDRITCDFCCSDVFQSFFECWDCVKAASPTYDGHTPFQEIGLGDGLIICPSCYVEGRSCQCEVMTAVQCRPFDELLQLRRRAINVLVSMRQDRTPSHNFSLIDEKQLLSEERLGIFRAAYLFRKQNQGTRSCRLKESSHNVPFTSALLCKKCHSYKCFRHLLQDQGIHSVEAILSQRKDDGNEAWHRRHSKPEIDKAKAEILRAEKNGTRLDLRLQLAKMASTFPFCNPSKVTLIKLGWYDKMMPIPDIPAREIETLSPLSSLTPSPALSSIPLPNCLDPIIPESSYGVSLTNNDEEPTKRGHSLDHSATSEISGNTHTPELTNVSSVPALTPSPVLRTAVTKKRRREILDCVLVQSAPFILKSAHNHVNPTFSQTPSGRGRSEQPSDHQLVPYSAAGHDEDAKVTSQSRKSPDSGKWTSSLSFNVAEFKVGRHTKRIKSVHGHRRQRSLSVSRADPSAYGMTSTVNDERPPKKARFPPASSVDLDEVAPPFDLPIVRKRKPGSLPKFHKYNPGNSVSEAGPSTSTRPRMGSDLYPRGRRLKGFQHSVDKSGDGSAQVLNKAFQNNAFRAVREIELSSESLPTLRHTNKLRFQAVVDENTKLREDIERIVEDSMALEQENARLQKLVSIKEAQLEELRRAEMTRPPSSQIVMPDLCSLVGHLLDRSGNNNRSSNAGSHRGRGWSVDKSPRISRQRPRHRRRPSFRDEDPGTTMRFQGGRGGFSGDHVENYGSNYRDGMGSPSRGHRGRPTPGFETGTSNHRGYLERNTDPPHQDHPVVYFGHGEDDFTHSDAYQSVESYAVPMESPRALPSSREVNWGERSDIPPTQISPNPALLENEQTKEEMQTSFDQGQDISSVSNGFPGPTGPEYWEDDYEQGASRQEGSPTLEGSSAQTEMFVQQLPLAIYDTPIPLFNPWVE